MPTALNYSNLIYALDKSFPQFEAYLGELRPSLIDNVSVYFTFFSVYLREHWNDTVLHQQLAILLQQMHEATDEATGIILHDFLLDVCSSCKEHGTDINQLQQHLTPPLQNQLQAINSQWLAAACELPRGCC